MNRTRRVSRGGGEGEGEGMRIYSRTRFGQNTQWRWVPRRLICHVKECDAWTWLGLQFHFKERGRGRGRSI
jgi:hypothetical protein